MQLNLGNAIRRLRTERGMTQEELAAYTGVSFQAVSKWECGTTTPDIALLPKLAVFFGVRIDDLFGITYTDELERVDFILEHERLTEENFAYSKKVLDKALENHPDDVRVLKTYARLYLAKNQRDRLAAGRMLREPVEVPRRTTGSFRTLWRVKISDPLALYVLLRKVEAGDLSQVGIAYALEGRGGPAPVKISRDRMPLSDFLNTFGLTLQDVKNKLK